MTYAMCPRCRDRWDGYHDELGHCPWETDTTAQADPETTETDQ